MVILVLCTTHVFTVLFISFCSIVVSVLSLFAVFCYLGLSCQCLMLAVVCCVCFIAVQQEKQEQALRQEVEGFSKTKLQRANTLEKNPLPDAESMYSPPRNRTAVCC